MLRQRMIQVVNKYKHIPTPNDVYIGRGSPLGNKYTHLTTSTKAEFICSTREEAIAAHKLDLLELIAKKDKIVCEALNELFKKAKSGDLNLVCYCAPKPCHGNFIKELIESKL